MPPDPLSDVLEAIITECSVYGRIEARAPWGIALNEPGLWVFGVVARGGCWLVSEGDEAPVALAGGDCFLAGGRAVALKDHPASRDKPLGEIRAADGSGRWEIGGAGVAAALVLGGLKTDRWCTPVLRGALPELMVLRAETAPSLGLRMNRELLLAETATNAPGSRLVAQRLGETLCAQMARAQAQSSEGGGWLRALGDRRLGGALAALHAEPGKNWTVESLAAVAGMSRSAFAAEFKRQLGETPLAYLTRWRMVAASRALRQGGARLSAVAEAAGYRSEAAFHRAFQRVLGIAPGRLRRSVATS